MSVKFPASEFFQNSGNAAAAFGEQLRDEIVTFACTIWGNFPGFIAQGTNPVQSFARGYMNQVCSPIQPPVPAPASPFLGGQCPVNYYWDVLFRASRPVPSRNINIGDQILARASNVFLGPIEGTSFDPFQELMVVRGRVIQNGIPSNATTFTQNTVGIDFGTEDPAPIEIGTIIIDTVISQSFTRVDGLPDNCGSLPADYPTNLPTSLDLTTNINITNLDGVDNVYNLVFNKTSNQYNFPMSFKLNGVNVSLDLGGLTIYGSPQIILPTSGNDVLPPGSDGGDDGAGGNNDTTYDNEYPVLPDLTVPITQDQLIEYVICTEGVLETLTTSLKLVTANIPYANLVIDILNSILTDVCEEDEVEPTVGLPDYYSVKPGVERPAIVYLYKEYINGKWGKSTYASTVHHPTQTAVDNINTIDVPDKQQGTYMVSLSLTDGSRIRVTGISEADAISNFNFILNQTQGNFIPTDIASKRIISRNLRIQEKTVKCRQIEYYPTGKLDAATPSIRRVINQTSMP